MKLRSTVGLLAIIIVCSCKQKPLINGLAIEFGPNLGTTHLDTLGLENFYVHMTATLTNDSRIPISLQMALSGEYEFPSYCGDSNKYKVFLLPEKLTPDTLTLYNNIVNGQHDFLNAPLDDTRSINKILRSGEFCVVTIGVLIPIPTNCAAVPRAVITSDKGKLYEVCSRQLNESFNTEALFEIGVKLEYYYKRKFIAPADGCSVIAFGQISIAQ